MRVVSDLPVRTRVIENLWIPMSDGCRLAARIILPEDAEANPVPAILEYIPYRKRDYINGDVNSSLIHLAGGESMIIKPTIDHGFGVGQYSTISDHKDNVHWFKATEDASFLFNIHVLNVEEGRASGRVYVDPDGERLSGGRIRARRVKSSEAYKLYG